MKFKKGELTEQSLEVILTDIGCLELTNCSDNEYYLSLIKNNLRDVWGLPVIDRLIEGNFIKYFQTLTAEEQNRILKDMGQ